VEEDKLQFRKLIKRLFKAVFFEAENILPDFKVKHQVMRLHV